MIILIDGYNLLRSIFHKVKGKLDKQRDQFIKQLGFYKNKKEQIKEIIVIFDGGMPNRATREIRHGIVVVFSGQNSNADEWIKDYIEENSNRELMVITMDREIVKKAKNKGAEVVGVIDFYGILQNTLMDDIENSFESDERGIRKYHDRENEALDLMMEQAMLSGYALVKDDDIYENNKKKGESHKLSKEEQRRISRLKKL